MMTLEILEAMDRETLPCTMVAPLIGCKPYNLHETARHAPEQLGFPVIVIGSRVLIPRRPFIKFMRGEAMQ